MPSQIDHSILGRAAAFGLAAIALAASSASAALAETAPPAAAGNVAYTLNISESGLKNHTGALKTDVALQPGMQRYDTTVKLPVGSTFHIVNLLDCAAGKLYTTDPDLKIYTVNDAAGVRPELLGTATLLPSFTTDGTGLLFPLPDTRTATQSGGVGISVAVADKGMETVGKAKTSAHHYTVAFTYSTSGGAEVPANAQAFDIWTDEAQPQPLNCIDQRLLGGGSAGSAIGGVTYTLTGDVDKLRGVLGFVPVQMTYDTGGAAGAVVYSLDKLSTKTADAKLFAVPGGKMHEVSNDQFGSFEHTALIARVRGGNAYYDDSSAGMRTTGPATDPNTQGLIAPPIAGR